MKPHESSDLYKINAYYSGIHKSKPYFTSGRLRNLHEVWHEQEQIWAARCKVLDIEYLRSLAPIEKLLDYLTAPLDAIWYPYLLMQYGKQHNMEYYKHCRWEEVFEEQKDDIMIYYHTNRQTLSTRIRGWTSLGGAKVLDSVAGVVNIQNSGTSCNSNTDGIVPQIES